MTEPRLHHLVPAFYLAGFTKNGTADDSIHVFDYVRNRRYTSSPRLVGRQRDYFRINEPGVVAALDSTIKETGPKVPPLPQSDPPIAMKPEDDASSARQWARTWLRSHKGPSKWIEGFEELGVTNFTPQLDERLYELLGVRHLVVHSAAVVDEDYLRHHPNSPWALGSEASIDEAILHGFAQTIFEFFAPIEAHFVHRYVRTAL